MDTSQDMDNIHIVAAILTVAQIVVYPSEERNQRLAMHFNELTGLFSQTEHNLRNWFRGTQKQA